MNVLIVVLIIQYINMKTMEYVMKIVQMVLYMKIIYINVNVN